MEARVAQAAAATPSGRNPTLPSMIPRSSLPVPGSRRHPARLDRGGVGKTCRSSLAPWAEGTISSSSGSGSAVALTSSGVHAGSAAASIGHAVPRRESAQIMSAAPKGANKPLAVRVRFTVPEFVTSPGQQLVLIGSVPALGCWDPEKAARMTWHSNHRWTAEVELEPGWHGALEFKVALNERDRYSWEPGGNRLLVVERPRPQPPQLPVATLLQDARTLAAASPSSLSESSMGGEGPSLSLGSNGSSSGGSPGSSPATSPRGVAAASAVAAAAAAVASAPVLEVVCDWGRAEAPSPALPASLQCGPLPGLLANGARVSALGAGGGVGLGGDSGNMPVIMANCQIVIPLFGNHVGPSSSTSSATPGVGQGAHDAHTGGTTGGGASSGAASSDEGPGGNAPPLSVSTEREHLVLVGSVPALGCWDPSQGLRLACDEGGMWRGRLELPMGYPVHAKLVVMDSASNTPRLWEAGPNRVIRLPDPPPGMLQSVWRGSGSALSAGHNSSNSAGAVNGRSTHPHHTHQPKLGGAHANANGHTHLASSAVTAAASSLTHASAAAGSNGVFPTAPSLLPAPSWNVMEDGEFMLVTHWGLPSFPHLLFLPSVEPAPREARAVHPVPRPRSVPCRFSVPQLVTHPGQQLLLVGSCPALGNWDPTRALRLRWGPGHTWHTTATLPAEADVEAKLVLWDGGTFRWESGPNRKLRAGELVSAAVPRGAWGEVVFMLYWGAAAHAPVPGRTPAVVIPRDGPHPDEVAAAEAKAEAGAGAAGGNIASPASLIALAAAAFGGRAGHSSVGEQAADGLMLRLVQFLASLQGVLPAAADAALNGAGSSHSGSGGHGGSAAASNAAALTRLAAMEAQVDAAQGALADASLAWQRELDTLRAQLAQSSLALAAEEDEVEALHAALGAKQAELQALRTALANAEATASAAVAAATTALASTGVHFSGLATNGSSAAASAAAASNGTHHGNGNGANNGNGKGTHHGNGSSNGNGVAASSEAAGDGLGTLATAMFQALTDQLAARQLEVDTLRRAAADAAAARTAEIAHLRVELSEAVAARHREVEAARVGAASAALARQQEVSGLMGQLAELQAARERDTAALQARVDSVLSAGAQETSRLSRQLAQACAAVEALDAQLTQERLNNASGAAGAAGEISRLRAALAARDMELQAAQAAAADASAAAAGSMAAARAGRIVTAAHASDANGVTAAAAAHHEPAVGLSGGVAGGQSPESLLASAQAELAAARAEAASQASTAAVLRVQVDSATAEIRALQGALQAASNAAAAVGLATQAAGPSPVRQGSPSSQPPGAQQAAGNGGGGPSGQQHSGIMSEGGGTGGEQSATEQLRANLRAARTGPHGVQPGAGNEGVAAGAGAGPIGSLFRRLSGRGASNNNNGSNGGGDGSATGNNILSLGGSSSAGSSGGSSGSSSGSSSAGSSGSSTQQGAQQGAQEGGSNSNNNGVHAEDEEESSA